MLCIVFIYRNIVEGAAMGLLVCRCVLIAPILGMKEPNVGLKKNRLIIDVCVIQKQFTCFGLDSYCTSSSCLGHLNAKKNTLNGLFRKLFFLCVYSLNSIYLSGYHTTSIFSRTTPLGRFIYNSNMSYTFGILVWAVGWVYIEPPISIFQISGKCPDTY